MPSAGSLSGESVAANRAFAPWSASDFLTNVDQDKVDMKEKKTVEEALMT